MSRLDREADTRPDASWTAALRSSRVFANASSLFGTTVVTSVLGFGFWAVAARVTSTAAVGGASAAISVMQLVGSLATLGLGTLLIGELGRRRGAARSLVVPAVLIAGVAATVAAVVVGVVVGHVGSTTPTLFRVGPPLVLFAIGAGLTAVCAVVDQALVGLGSGGRQLHRNAVFAVTKLALLGAVAVVRPPGAEVVYLVWALGQLVSLVVLWRRTSTPVEWLRHRGGFGALRRLGGAAVAHHLMNVAAHAPQLVLPVAVSATLGPSENAVFFVSLMLAGFAWSIPTSLSTALFAIPGDDLTTLRRELRLSLRVSTIVAVASAVGFALLGRPVLLAFGERYVEAGPCLTVLGALTGAAAVKSLYVAVSRAQGRLARAAVATTVGSLAEICGGIVGTGWGLRGVALGMGVAMLGEAALFGPRVLSAARRPGTGRVGAAL